MFADDRGLLSNMLVGERLLSDGIEWRATSEGSSFLGLARLEGLEPANPSLGQIPTSL